MLQAFLSAVRRTDGLRQRWRFTLGADNVLNEYPDENSFANSTNGQFPYSNLSPFGFNGAFVYGRVAYKW